MYWETAEHYKKRTGKELRDDAPVVGYHSGYEDYGQIESYRDAKEWADRIVIVDAEHGVPHSTYSAEITHIVDVHKVFNEKN